LVLLFDATDSDPSAGANVFQPVHGTQSRVGSGADSPLAGVGIYYVGAVVRPVNDCTCFPARLAPPVDGCRTAAAALTAAV